MLQNNNVYFYIYLYRPMLKLIMNLQLYIYYKGEKGVILNVKQSARSF